jgi:vitamin B12/bleomycin/antimicrobial peptide transport system ATP-binding/permease protein
MATVPATTFRTRFRRATDVRTRDRFFRMFRRFAASEAGRRARWLFGGLLALLITINGLNVLNSFVGRDFMTALEKRATAEFIRQGLYYVGVFSLSTLAIVFLRFTEETLALTWREWLTRWAVRHYLRPPVYQRLSDRLIANGEVANPDQRMSDDIRTFTTVTLSLLILFLNGTFTIIAFSGVMWSISPALFLVTVFYAFAGSLMTISRGRPLVKLNEAQLDKEANFRAELIHVRENAEPLAIARREDRLRFRLFRRIEDLAANFRRIIRVNRNLGLFTTGYNYLIQIIPTLLVAPLFISGKVEFGVVTQSAMAFAQLVGAFSLIITQFQSISSYAAVVTRLGVLDEGIEQARTRPVMPDEVCTHHDRKVSCPVCSARWIPSTAIEMVTTPAEFTVTYERLTLLSPTDGRVLTKELNATIAPGSRLLILGPNDEAKSALFRSTAGTWSMGGGRIVRPGDDRMQFMSERPYLPPGTLREVLTSVGRPIPLERIQSTMKRLDLEPVLARVGGFESERRWDNILSLGEQKLVGFARILLTAPAVVFLERPDTGLDPDLLRRVLDLLAGSAVTIITVGTPDDARRFYQAALELKNDGGWQWTPLSGS